MGYGRSHESQFLLQILHYVPEIELMLDSGEGWSLPQHLPNLPIGVRT